MAKYRIDNGPEQEPPSEGSSSGVRLAILIAVVALIVITGMNLYEIRRRRTELNDQLGQLAAALNTRPANPANPAAPDPTGPDPKKVYTVKTEGAPSLGPKTAPIKIAEFSDFQCSYCSTVGPTLKQITEVYKDKVQIVWKNLPLPSIHKNAMGAALASEAAHRQGKFWEMHDKLFQDPGKLGLEDLKQYAKELGLDTAQFERDLLSPEIKKRVGEDMGEARSLGISGTPTFFINGRFLEGAQPFGDFAKIINAELQRLNLPVPPTAAAP